MDWVRANILGLTVLSYISYLFFRSLYRLYLHPLSTVPGPKWAGVTEWYSLRYHAKDGGTLSQAIQEMHQAYGPIVRIAPNEVHIATPSFHDTLFNFNPLLNKPRYYIDNLQCTASTAHHKARRRALDNFFSRASVQKLEGLVKEGVAKMCHIIQKAKMEKQPANFAVLYRALSADIISEYALGENYRFLDDMNASNKFFGDNGSFFGAMYFFRDIAICSWLLKLMVKLPSWMLASGDGLGVVEFQQKITGTIERINKELRTAEEKQRTRPTVFVEYMKSSLPSQDKTPQKQLELAVLLISAGFETSGHTLSTAHYHLLANPGKLANLQTALKQAWPDTAGEMPGWKELEKIPYLRAVILEGLRLSLAAIGRLSRVNAEQSMEFEGYTFPRGTVLSMSHWSINFDESLFPEPYEFAPERWLRGRESAALERSFWPFSKGQRACLGVHLAWAEMYLTLAAVFRNFDMELYDTNREDVDPKYDHFVPSPATAKGVRAMVK